MSVDLFCYVSSLVEDANKILARVRIEHPELFASEFIIYDAMTADNAARELAFEHHFDAVSRFLVSLNDKSASGGVMNVAHKLEAAFGKGCLLVLHTNEIAILRPRKSSANTSAACARRDSISF